MNLTDVDNDSINLNKIKKQFMIRLFYIFFYFIVCSSIMSCTKNVYEYYGVGSETEHETDNGKTDEKKDKKETTEEIQTIEAFIKNDFGETPIWVEGYIVGSCTKSIKMQSGNILFHLIMQFYLPMNQEKPILRKLLQFS